MDEKINLEEFRPFIVDAVSRTFGEIAFTDVLSVEPGGAGLSRENILSLDILRPFPGTVFLFVPHRLKTLLAENIYGPETTLQERELDDAIMETLNILTADFLTARYQQDAEYKLELPQMLFDEVPAHMEEGLLVHFEAEGIPFDLYLAEGGRGR